MDYHFYIIRKGISTNKQHLKEGEVIVKMPKDFPMFFEDGDGPYNSIRALKKHSSIFKLLQSRNSKRAQQIFDERYIVNAKEIMAIPKGTSFSKDTMEAFLHSTNGRVLNSDVTGVHFYDPKKVKILEILDSNMNTRVFKAKIEFYDSNTKKWITKVKPSTFFPRNWNKAKMLMECKHAVENSKIGEIKTGKINSTTQNGIDVIIQVKNGIVKSIYPDL